MPFRQWVLLATLVVAGHARAAEALPWKFGMSPDDVRAVSAFGPYRSFSNGDLETYRGQWDGREENVQFYFADGKLHRVSVYLYEGADLEDAAVYWAALRRSMERHFGALDTPGNDAKADDRFQDAAKAAVGQGTRNFIAPVGSVGKPAYGIFKREQIEGKPVYFVILHFDLAP